MGFVLHTLKMGSFIVCLWSLLLLLAFYISLLFISSVHNANCWSYKACAHVRIYVRDTIICYCLCVSMLKTVFPLCADRDLLLFVSKSRKTEKFISQIIFLFFVVSLRSRFVCFSTLCVFHLNLPICCLHARLGISHKRKAQNNFRNTKNKTVLPNVNHSRFHLRYGMVQPSSIVHTRAHSLTHRSQKNLSWLLIFTGPGSCGNCANGPLLQFPFVLRM